jgi:hypothetical protein
VWLCMVCVLLAYTGSAAATAHTNASSAGARAASSSEAICCFTLSIYVEEDLSLVIPPSTSGGVVNPAGSYRYILRGTAYGLATLRPSDGGTQGVVSTVGGVAAGRVEEKNDIVFEGGQFGCPSENDKERDYSLAFRRTVSGDPEYRPPPGHGDNVGIMGFGDPFGGSGPFSPVCNWAGQVEMSAFNLLRAKDPQARFLEALQDGPIIGSGLSVRGLLKGEHEKKIMCFQVAYHTGEPEFTSRVGIVIDIVHHSPDDRKRLIHKLRGYLGKMAPPDNPGERVVGNLEEQSRPPPAGGCS